MSRTLMILEVSQKQSYIFASKKLRENAARSWEISHVTGDTFFRETARDLYRTEDNLVYSGGGHTILQFSDPEQTLAFSHRVTESALRQYRGMEIFVKTMPYNNEQSPGDNLKALTAALEAKKALRRASFRKTSLGVEALDRHSFLPAALGEEDRQNCPEALEPPAGWEFPARFEELAAGDNFIAVVHIDGNAMGKRVESLYGENTLDWDSCRASLQRFSASIQADFERAFQEMAAELLEKLPDLAPPILPIRPVILAGDDVCFVTAGKIGLECARVFLKHLTAMRNQEDGKPYAACAGVALVHRKFPFHQAYDLAEQLCGSAKQFGAGLDSKGRISAMDWHIEFGQLKDSLSDLRKDYATEDGKRLELRPVTVVVPDDIDTEKTGGVRTYAFFRELCRAMQGEYGKIARSKIKDLRTAFKQGEVESCFFLQDKEVQDLLYHGFTARYQEQEKRLEQYRNILQSGKLEKSPFMTVDGTDRCLFFDAIEMIDHCSFFEEGEA